MDVSMYVCIYVCMYISIYVCMYVSMYVCIYLFLLIQTCVYCLSTLKLHRNSIMIVPTLLPGQLPVEAYLLYLNGFHGQSSLRWILDHSSCICNYTNKQNHNPSHGVEEAHCL